MKNRLIFIYTILMSFLSIQAQNKQRIFLSKQKAISTVLDANYGIKIAQNQEKIAANNQDILNSGFLPSLSANAGATIDNTDTTTDFDGALREDGTPRNAIEIEDAETKRYNASLDVNYTLFDGLGRLYNFKQLKEQYNLSVLQSREVIENTILQLFSVYYEVARLEENIEILKKTLQISKRRETRAQYQFDYGQVNKLEVLNARVDITTDSINLLNNHQQLRNNQRDLNVILNKDLDELVAVDTIVKFINPLKIEKFIENSTSTNIQLQQIESERIINEHQIKRARSFLLPIINLTGSYGWNRAENPASAFFPGNNRTDLSISAGANLRWNLFDGGNSITTIKNAKLLKENTEIEASRLKQEIYRDIKNAKEAYQNALKILELQNQNVITSQDNFSRSQERFKLGQITSIEFRQAQINLLNSKMTRSSAKYTAKLSELRLLQFTGQLLNVDF